MFNIIVAIQALLQFIHARFRARGRAWHPHVEVSLRQNLALKVVHQKNWMEFVVTASSFSSNQYKFGRK